MDSRYTFGQKLAAGFARSSHASATTTRRAVNILVLLFTGYLPPAAEKACIVNLTWMFIFDPDYLRRRREHVDRYPSDYGNAER